MTLLIIINQLHGYCGLQCACDITITLLVLPLWFLSVDSERKITLFHLGITTVQWHS